MRQSGCASWPRRTWHTGWVLSEKTTGLNACSVLSHRPHGLGPGCGPLLGGHFCFGSRTSPGFLKGSKQGRWPRLLTGFLCSFPFSVGPHPGKGPRQKPEFNNKFMSFVFKSPGSKMPWSQGKLVFYSSVVASGTCTLTYYLIQKAFSKASYYQEALEQLHGHPEALEALGTPLNVHCLRLTDKYNFVDIAEAQLKIPVSGPKSEGHLHVISSRDAPFQRYWEGGTFRRSS
uniref:uncharacterized protein LOC118534706 isoform X3 n=1 Tax=Halichoerus grypus TaxID=9711 RepID=UPI001658EB37|nr:uncharacterized protein LOC118534706 isoform X3 [Halichoerus grypus]